jgi:hypothetical protein
MNGHASNIYTADGLPHKVTHGDYLSSLKLEKRKKVAERAQKASALANKFRAE